MVETNHENTRMDDMLLTILEYAYRAVMGNVDFAAVTGVSKRNMCTEEEWREIVEYPLGDPETLKEALKNSEKIHGMLREKRQLERHVLGKYPLVLLRGVSTGISRGFWNGLGSLGK